MSRQLAVFVPSVLVLSIVAAAVVGQPEERADPTPTVAAAESEPAPAADGVGVERGRYLVTAVAMCGECHTSRNASGELRMNDWLKGASVPVTTPEGYEAWAYKAPRIAGLPQHKDDEFVRLMTTGINRDGARLRAPMPQFRLSIEDAKAVEAYLRSLD